MTERWLKIAEMAERRNSKSFYYTNRSLAKNGEEGMFLPGVQVLTAVLNFRTLQ